MLKRQFLIRDWNHGCLWMFRQDSRIECRDCEFIDSAGVSALLRIRSAVTARGGSVTLVDPSPAVERILAITGLGEAFGVAAG